jgi:hypothetical protein
MGLSLDSQKAGTRWVYRRSIERQDGICDQRTVIRGILKIEHTDLKPFVPGAIHSDLLLVKARVNLGLNEIHRS